MNPNDIHLHSVVLVHFLSTINMFIPIELGQMISQYFKRISATFDDGIRCRMIYVDWFIIT